MIASSMQTDMSVRQKNVARRLMRAYKYHNSKNWKPDSKMLELNASKFFDTIQNVQRIKTIIEQVFDDEGRAADVVGARQELHSSFEELAAATAFVGAEVASMAARRMAARLADSNDQLKMLEVGACIADVQSRLSDEVQLITFFILNRNQKVLMSDANNLVQWDINRIFPDAGREIEEGCKCLALQRPTAAVFHAMRTLEVGIKALAALLEIPDPTKPADRNWGIILRSIKEKIDQKYPATERMPGSVGASFEKLYASLDAVKNPWRNGTMHVESFYSDSEATHIMRCVAVFMQQLASTSKPEEVSEPTGNHELTLSH